MKEIKNALGRVSETCKQIDVLPSHSYFQEYKDKQLIRLVLTSPQTSEAYCRKPPTTINTYLWFSDFWIYLSIELELIKNSKRAKQIARDNPNILCTTNNCYRVTLSLRVYYGDRDPAEKTLLFRAEWDGYEDNTIHPQPHWHFHYLPKRSFGKDSFLQIPDEEQEFSIERMHFAMNGQWRCSIKRSKNKASTFGYKRLPKKDKDAMKLQINQQCIHPINDIDVLANWLAGLLIHIHTQLKYISDKSKR